MSTVIRNTFIPPLPARLLENGILSIDGNSYEVAVTMYQVTSIGDGRHDLEGILWSSAVPPGSISHSRRYTIMFVDGSDVKVGIESYNHTSLDDDKMLTTVRFMRSEQLRETP